MGKGKHKKVLRSEKAKVKLKGAKLPKGQNITKTDFKVKKILIREQLKEAGDSQVLQKVNIKDLIGKLRHNNSSIKQETLKSIRETVTSSPGDLFPKHLGEVLQTVGQLCLDIDKEVRRESFRCLQALFGAIDVALVEPFFDMLSSYLRCAMTHLQNPIQEDSLLLLDVLLHSVPHLVAKDSDRIFGNFLDMVSKLRSESQPGRTLSLNLGKKITAVKWRIRVLERLQRLLQALNASLTCADTETATKSINLNPNDSAFYAPIIRKPQEMWFVEISGLFINEMSSLKKKISSGDFSEAKKATFYVEQMVPLLVETWLEIRPQNTGKAQGVLGQEAANTFSLILGIFHELWAMVVRCDEQNQSQEMQNWLRKTHSRDFCQTFMIGFPFSFTDKSHSAQEENLRLCHLFCCLCATPTEQMHEIIDYTSACLTRTHSAQSWGCLLKVLRIIVVENGKSSPAQARKLCEKLLSLHTKLPPPACQLRGRILLLICHAITTGGVLDKDSLLPWFQRMRHTLCHEEKLPEDLIDALGRLYTISREFVLYLGQELPSILINISRVEITESTNALQSKRKLLNFLFWLPGKIAAKEIELLGDEDLRKYVQGLNCSKKS
ncbi:testis-expressed protein 10 homolog [Lutzomyia longipalpis]|uniref:testis-expressed protein 10 homolog n=1 Tax=Lutzomyia longipalpis TaxID=7200 RepID=UPI0024847125|nr:testis-expressed protein 10 homolog [Lutzomyia longipalpis]